MPAILTRDQIFGASLRTIEVDVPSLGGTVRVRELTISDAERFAGRNTSSAKDAAELLAVSIVDGDGQLMFRPDDADDIDKLAKLSAGTVEVLSRAILDLNRMTAKSREEAEKN